MNQIARMISLDIYDAWSGLSRRPLRSVLSSLGIGIGVASLIAMLSISEGAKKNAIEKVDSLGTHTLRVETLIPVYQGGKSGVNLSQGLNVADGEQIAQWLGSRGKVGAYVRSDNTYIKSGVHTVSATVLGVNTNWFSAENLPLSSGRKLQREDVFLREKYCVLGASLAHDLQADLFDTIRMDNFPVTVVGIALPKGMLLTEGTGLSALDFDTTFILPITSMPSVRLSGGTILLDGLVISLARPGEEEILGIADQVEQILLANHRNIADFRIVIPIKLLEEVRERQKVFSLIMGTIAGLSLLVGGIGVMNVMLANIAEQTREIGLRMAVGASRLRIISLYLWNAVLLTLSGGLWGTIAGVLLSLIIENYAGWEIIISTFSVFLAPFSAVITGIIFGIHPAVRAASLDPALALRDA